MCKHDYLLQTYGRAETSAEIIEKYPLQMGKLTENEMVILFSPKYTLTFDIHLAFKMREDGVKVLIWGKMYENECVFLFERKQKKINYVF